MTIAKIVLVSLLTLILLAGCHGHDADFASGSGHLKGMSDAVFLANLDGKDGFILQKAERGYAVSGGNGHVMVTPIDATSGKYWVQYSNLDEKTGKRHFTSFAAILSGNRVALLTTDAKAATSKAELDAMLRADFSNTDATSVSYEILDLRTTTGQQKAQAFVTAAKTKQAGKPKPTVAAGPAPKQAGQFYYVEDKDVMTGAASQFIYGFPADGEVGKPPYVRLGCYGINDKFPIGLTIAWGAPVRDIFPDGSQNASFITVRFGDNAPMNLGVDVSQNFGEVYAPGPGTALASGLATGLLGALVPTAEIASIRWDWGPEIVHRAFRTYDQVAVRSPMMSGGSRTMVFDTTGFRDVLRNFADHCQRR